MSRSIRGFGTHLTPRVARLRVYSLAILLALADPSPCETSAAPPKSAEEFAARLERILSPGGQAKANLGAHVIDLSTDRTIYAHRNANPLIPASNMKLMVMAAVIDLLGADFKFRTVLAVRGDDLVVIGGGDPTIGDERLAQARGESPTALFHEWAGDLKAAGVAQIPGNLVVDDLIFDLEFTHPNWPADQYQNWYEAPVGGLNFHSNCVAAVVTPTQPGGPAAVRLVPGNTLVRVKNRTVTGKKQTVVVARPRKTDTLVLSGSVSKQGRLKEVTVHDPGLFFGSVLKTVLASEGIPVAGKVLREKVRIEGNRLPEDCHLVAVHRSPISDALARCGKNSLGMMAECLFKTIGDRHSRQGTWSGGRSAIHAFLRKAGAHADQVTVDDGSGLSRHNRLSAATATRVLRFMFNGSSDRFDLFRRSLAVSGTDGTLRKRLKEERTKGRVFAKTGTINGVRTLAGYIHTHSDRWLAFAFFYNYAGKPPSPSAKSRQDRACRLLVNWPELPNGK